MQIIFPNGKRTGKLTKRDHRILRESADLLDAIAFVTGHDATAAGVRRTLDQVRDGGIIVDPRDDEDQHESA